MVQGHARGHSLVNHEIMRREMASRQMKKKMMQLVLSISLVKLLSINILAQIPSCFCCLMAFVASTTNNEWFIMKNHCLQENSMIVSLISMSGFHSFFRWLPWIHGVHYAEFRRQRFCTYCNIIDNSWLSNSCRMIPSVPTVLALPSWIWANKVPSDWNMDVLLPNLTSKPSKNLLQIESACFSHHNSSESLTELHEFAKIFNWLVNQSPQQIYIFWGLMVIATSQWQKDHNKWLWI